MTLTLKECCLLLLCATAVNAATRAHVGLFVCVCYHISVASETFHNIKEKRENNVLTLQRLGSRGTILEIEDSVYC